MHFGIYAFFQIFENFESCSAYLHLISAFFLKFRNPPTVCILEELCQKVIRNHQNPKENTKEEENTHTKNACGEPTKILVLLALYRGACRIFWKNDNDFLERRFSVSVRCAIPIFVIFPITRMCELCFKKGIRSIGCLSRSGDFFEVGNPSSKNGR